MEPTRLCCGQGVFPHLALAWPATENPMECTHPPRMRWRDCTNPLGEPSHLQTSPALSLRAWPPTCVGSPPPSCCARLAGRTTLVGPNYARSALVLSNFSASLNWERWMTKKRGMTEHTVHDAPADPFGAATPSATDKRTTQLLYLATPRDTMDSRPQQ